MEISQIDIQDIVLVVIPLAVFLILAVPGFILQQVLLNRPANHTQTAKVHLYFVLPETINHLE